MLSLSKHDGLLLTYYYLFTAAGTPSDGGG